MSTQDLLAESEDAPRGWLIDLSRDRDRWRASAMSSRAALTDAHSHYRLALIVSSLVFFAGGLVLGLVAAGLR